MVHPQIHEKNFDGRMVTFIALLSGKVFHKHTLYGSSFALILIYVKKKYI